jgi:phosphoribosylanthranilate isomerase
MKIKVCGMREQENIAALCQLPIDFIGFIFYQKSSRYVDSLPNVEIHEAIKRVGVFVNASIEDIEQKVDFFDLDFIQLHGDETAEYCQSLKNKGYQIIKAFAVDGGFDFQQIDAYEASCDFFLLDAKGASYGGNGVQFDWRVLEKYPSDKPFFLSGGIDLSSIDGIRKLDIPQLYAIDVNSKFEIKPGLKDIEKVKNLTTNINGSYQVDAQGYYGEFGGAYIPEMLYPNIEELKREYLKIMGTESFQKEFKSLLKDYVGRPTPLYFAKRLSKKYKTNIYLKREDLCHTGAHKINNTIGQILIAKALKKPRIIAETGAGQHGVATATVCALMGLECIVYMGAVDVERQAPNVARMKMLGAKVIPVHSGSKTLKDATNEAIRDWISNPENTHYIIGSVVGPHPYPDMVAQFQSVISKEIKKQLKEQTGSENPDKIIACIGGGSNAAGAFFHYLEEQDVDLIAVEAAGEGINSGRSAATSVLGTTGIIHASKTLLMQTKDGQVVEPHSISAGLDYPGIGPLHAHLIRTGRVKVLSVSDKESLAAAYELTKLEGIIPALESAHALAALDKIEFKPNEVVVLNLSGRGDKDLETYMEYL